MNDILQLFSSNTTLTTAEVAEQLGVSTETARRRCKNAGLVGTKNGASFVWNLPGGAANDGGPRVRDVRPPPRKGEKVDYPAATGVETKKVADAMVAALDSAWAIRAEVAGNTGSYAVMVPHRQKRQARALCTAFLAGFEAASSITMR